MRTLQLAAGYFLFEADRSLKQYGQSVELNGSRPFEILMEEILMNDSMILQIAVTLVFGGALVGIFCTKTVGFGKYTTSTLILTLVLFVAALAYMSGKVEWAPMANLLFAVAGFAGGLITAKVGEK